MIITQIKDLQCLEWLWNSDSGGKVRLKNQSIKEALLDWAGGSSGTLMILLFAFSTPNLATWRSLGIKD